ncbi:hypothetical protein ABZT06_46245 [Streptomyces sp. NPDC005483]|uniref:hypothetical protein n=1 Tax=Streptomyces sp. NPDC005483 TaxID=3154882 RepID=UPI0033A7F1F1
MPHAEGLELPDRRLGTHRTQSEHSAADEIMELRDGLPLALAVPAARALAQPRFPLTALAARLRDPDGCLDALAGRDARTDLRSSFHPSYEALSSGGARLFQPLGLHPTRDITLPAAWSAPIRAAPARSWPSRRITISSSNSPPAATPARAAPRTLANRARSWTPRPRGRGALPDVRALSPQRHGRHHAARPALRTGDPAAAATGRTAAGVR